MNLRRLNFSSRMIRDALVEKIWEGTTNIMALDLVRACREGCGIALVKVSSTLTRPIILIRFE